MDSSDLVDPSHMLKHRPAVQQNAEGGDQECMQCFPVQLGILKNNSFFQNRVLGVTVHKASFTVQIGLAHRILA